MSASDGALLLSPLLERLRPFFSDYPQPVYLVGGAVRDALLGRECHDLDFVVPEKAIRLSFRLADHLGVPAYPLDRERDTGRVVLAEEETTLDFARYRGDDLAADLLDRDFTINSMALPVTAVFADQVIDLAGGRQDLADRLLRQTNPNSLAADPIRALRAVRLAYQFGLSIESETAESARQAAALLDRISPERIRDEWLKLLHLPDAGRAVARLDELTLLAAFLPELAALRDVGQSAPHHEAVLAHTCRVLGYLQQLLAGLPAEDKALSQALTVLEPFRSELEQHLARPVDGAIDGRTLIRLGALFHDVGKAETRSETPEGRIRFLGHETTGADTAATVLRRLRMSNEAIKHVRQIVAGHMRPLQLVHEPQVSRRAVYRFFRDLGLAGLDVGLLTLADHLATHLGTGPEAEWQRLLQLVERLYSHYFHRHTETVSPPQLVDGRRLIQSLSLVQGPEVGRLLRLIEEAQAAGEISTAAEALALAREAHLEGQE